MTGGIGNTVICTYRIKSGKEQDFLELLKIHWPTLHRLGLVTEEEARVFRGRDADEKTFFVELFEWKGDRSAHDAHESPGVQKIWGPMAELTEERGGRPAMEFPHVVPVEL
ncbi:MAG: putative quinol monooxygenase [Planctomycetota bacterium]|jgi:hypothetical protein